MSGLDSVLSVEHLGVTFETPRGPLPAVNDVSFTLSGGETLGIVGESGAGKTTLATAILKLLPPNAKIVSGRVVVEGVDMMSADPDTLNKKLRWNKIAYVPQASQNALDPLYKIDDQFVETVQAHSDMSKKEILARASELLLQVGVDPVKLSSYPWQLSGGQKQRVMIALSLILNPSVIIMDEPTTALDTIIQAQILELLRQLREFQRMSSIFISHDISVIANVADRIAVMYAGKIVELGTVKEVFSDPLHPYTQGLLKSVPDMRRSESFGYIAGLPPDLVNLPPGCSFRERCPVAVEICSSITPPLENYGRNHFAACHVVGGRRVRGEA
ncbi:MAG: ABC transporter ATP-binding protein [Candidatus Marsarchaeota archaeon]|nr:ABC transporter ATP-binding protein [Candidatus Marsarchaeota archaeon]